MEYTQDYLQNLQMFKDCLHFKHIDRIPHISNFYTWKLFDMDPNIKLSEALRDYKTLEKAQRLFQERYHFDIHLDFCTRNFVIPTDVLGSSQYIFDDEAGSVAFLDHVMMEGTEYPDYAEDYLKLHWKMFNRKRPDVTKGQFIRAMLAQQEAGEFSAHIMKVFRDEYNCAGVWNQNLSAVIAPPLERFYKYYRGIRETAVDLRKHKTQVKDTLERVHYEILLPALEEGLKADTNAFITDFFSGILAHAMLSTKQWEELYWPYLKEYLDRIVAADKSIICFIEDSILRFAEYFQDYPKGHLLFYVELDDMVEMRKKLPNVCLAGGMPSDLLQNGTPQECIDRVKYLADTLGDGFMLGQDKMISYRNDCKRENLQAVCDYVNGFRW